MQNVDLIVKAVLGHFLTLDNPGCQQFPTEDNTESQPTLPRVNAQECSVERVDMEAGLLFGDGHLIMPLQNDLEQTPNLCRFGSVRKDFQWV